LTGTSAAGAARADRPHKAGGIVRNVPRAVNNKKPTHLRVPPDTRPVAFLPSLCFGGKGQGCGVETSEAWVRGGKIGLLALHLGPL